MKRLLIGFLLILSLSASVFWFVRLRPIYRAFYSDAEAIKAPVARAPLREILWQPAARVHRGETEPIDEYEPRISADGSTLFFVRGKAGENADLFVAERTGAGWSEPRAIEGVNSDADDLGPEPCADGNTLYFYSNRDGGLGGYDLWIAHRSTRGWDPPTPLAPPVNSSYNDYGPALSPDGRTLYFASNRPVEPDSRDPSRNPSSDPWNDRWPATLREDLTVRTYDLYQAEVTDDGIQAPIPVAPLNTPFNEGAPAVSAFGDFLYFASDRPGGRGGFDLYRSRRLRGEYRAPENLGDAVNTPANDLDPALGMGGYRLYFSSDRPQQDAPKSGEHRYGLFMSTSREVFRDVEVEQRPPIAWAAIGRVVAPWLLLAILVLLALLTLLALVKTFRERRVSLLAKCLLGSLLAHLALMFLFTLWQVSASIAEGIRSGGEIRISLGAGGTVDALFAQLQGRATDANLPSSELPTLRPDAPVLRTTAPSIVQTSLATLTLASMDDAPLVEPTASESAPRKPASSTPVAPPPPRIAVDSTALSIHAPRSDLPLEGANERTSVFNAPDVRRARPPQRAPDSQFPRSAELVTPSAISVTLPVDSAPGTLAQLGPTESPQRSTRAPDRALARVDAMPSSAAIELPTPDSGSRRFAFEPFAEAPSAKGTTLRPMSSPGRKTSSSVDPHAAAQVAMTSIAPLPAMEPALLDGSSVAPTESATHAVAPPRMGRAPVENLGIPAFSLRTDRAEFPANRNPSDGHSTATEAGPALPHPLNPITGIPLRRMTPATADASSSPAFEQSLPARIGAVDLAAFSAIAPEAPVSDRRPPSPREARLRPHVPQSALPRPNLDLRVPAGPSNAEEAIVATRDPRPDRPRDGASDEPIGTVFGRVTDAESGAPLPGSLIRLDVLDAAAITAIADDHGEYALVVPSVPDDFALSASMPEYAPSASNVRSAAVEKGRLEVNFALRKLSEEVVVTEAAPELHHLGDDVFDGDINSQFQKSSEGNGFETRFDLSDRQIAPFVQRAEVRMLVKGVQRRHGMVINGTLLAKRLSKAPRDGGFGEFAAAIDPALLRAGENTFRLLCAPPVGSDFDDFEFVNVQIHLVLGAH